MTRHNLLRGPRGLTFALLLLGFVAAAAVANASETRIPSFPSEPEIGDPSLVPAGTRLVEGDMLVRDEKLNKAGGFVVDFWPGGDVPYEWDSNLSTARRDTVRAAMAILESVANINFYVRGSESDYVHIQWHTSNTNSEVGQVGGRQIINVANWATMWNLVHELMHTLGMVHEHTRSDRGTYVSIDWSEISQTACSGGPCDSNFQIDSSTLRYGYYDFDSVMHYGQFAFAIGSNPTINCKSAYSSWQSLMGQRNHLSYLDEITLCMLYPKSNWRFVDDDATPLLEYGLFFFPWGSFDDGMTQTPSSGTLWIQPGSYDGVGTWSDPITIKAPLGNVNID